MLDAVILGGWLAIRGGGFDSQEVSVRASSPLSSVIGSSLPRSLVPHTRSISISAFSSGERGRLEMEISSRSLPMNSEISGWSRLAVGLPNCRSLAPILRLLEVSSETPFGLWSSRSVDLPSPFGCSVTF